MMCSERKNPRRRYLLNWPKEIVSEINLGRVGRYAIHYIGISKFGARLLQTHTINPDSFRIQIATWVKGSVSPPDIFLSPSFLSITTTWRKTRVLLGVHPQAEQQKASALVSFHKWNTGYKWNSPEADESSASASSFVGTQSRSASSSGANINSNSSKLHKWNIYQIQWIHIIFFLFFIASDGLGWGSGNRTTTYRR